MRQRLTTPSAADHPGRLAPWRTARSTGPSQLATIAATAAVILQPAILHAQEFQRGDGFYVSWWKVLILLPFVWIWVKGCDFVNTDSQRIGDDIAMPQDVWTPIVVFTFMVLFFVSLLIPNFIGCVAVCAVASLAPVLTYVFMRNAKVNPEIRVLTPKHISEWLKGGGKRGVVERTLPHEQGAPVEFQPIGAGGGEQLIRARGNVPSYLLVKQLVADLIDRAADRAMFDYSAEQVEVRFDVDGVWHPLEPRDRESGDALLESFKLLCGADPKDRRGRQHGEFKCKYKKEKYSGSLTSQGTKTGERVLVAIDYGDKFNTLEEIGMREKLREVASKHIRGSAGMVLISAMPTGGLSTLWTVTMKSTDRFTRDFVCLIDKGKKEPAVENLAVHEYDLAAGQTPDQLIPQILLREPEVLVAPEPPNGETVRMLCHQVNQEHQLSIISVRAKEVSEALLRVLLLKAPPVDFAKAIKCVINVRLVRKLCKDCKMAYEPSPQDLQRLGIPPGRVQYLYTEYQPPPPDSDQKPLPPCETCGGIGYRGRTGLFEVLEVNDAVRQVLAKQPKLELLRQAARQAGCRTLQEEGILLVAKGETSLNELRRVLRG
ncbi:MAG: Flp pilus assembly complex ATPase component TadA [Planctomycetales bacterium]|nr:Flp pilus assembly complex ATPase component TadA [Planctomycetales bacterium]